MSSERVAMLSIDGEAPVRFPLVTGTHGNPCLDIRTLGGVTGCFAYDSGYASTASCKSKITCIDGERGELLYRGYPVEQLATKCDFVEVAYLLKHGELPDADRRQSFASALRKQAPVHQQMAKFYEGFRRDANPMAVMVGVVGALSAFHHDAADFSDGEQRSLSFHLLVGKMPTILAMAYKYSIGEPFMSPRRDLDYTANFLYMMFATPRAEFLPNPLLVRALDRLFIVHAEHAQDASTATARMAGSSGANPFACVAAAIACLSGPAHGGAGEACVQMLEAIGDVPRVADFVARARVSEKGFRLVGFGHPRYRQFDPRTPLLREVCDQVLQELGLENARLFRVAKALETMAWEDSFFLDNGLYPNLDFYSAILQKALGIPAALFACVVALARTPGWMAQWEEMVDDPEYKIARPRQLYTGAKRRCLATRGQSGG